MKRINVVNLQNLLNVAMKNDHNANVAANDIQKILNDFVRDILRDKGLYVQDSFNPLTLFLGPLPNCGENTLGRYNDDDKSIEISLGGSNTNAAKMLLTVAHETMHMMEYFIFNHMYDDMIQRDFSPNAGEISHKSRFDSAMFAFFSNKYEKSKCDYCKFYDFLRSQPLLHKDNMTVYKADHYIYSNRTSYDSNTTEWQANYFAITTVPTVIDLNHLHDIDKMSFQRAVKDIAEEFATDIARKESLEFKKTQIKESKEEARQNGQKVSRFRRSDKEVEFLKPHHSAMLEATRKIAWQTVCEVAGSVAQQTSVEDMAKTELIALKEKDSFDALKQYAQEIGAHCVSDGEQIEGVAKSYESYEKMNTELRNNRTYKDRSDLLYIDLVNHKIIVAHDRNQTIENENPEFNKENVKPSRDLIDKIDTEDVQGRIDELDAEYLDECSIE